MCWCCTNSIWLQCLHENPLFIWKWHKKCYNLKFSVLFYECSVGTMYKRRLKSPIASGRNGGGESRKSLIIVWHFASLSLNDVNVFCSQREKIYVHDNKMAWKVNWNNVRAFIEKSGWPFLKQRTRHAKNLKIKSESNLDQDEREKTLSFSISVCINKITRYLRWKMDSCDNGMANNDNCCSKVPFLRPSVHIFFLLYFEDVVLWYWYGASAPEKQTAISWHRQLVQEVATKPFNPFYLYT